MPSVPERCSKCGAELHGSIDCGNCGAEVQAEDVYPEGPDFDNMPGGADDDDRRV